MKYKEIFDYHNIEYTPELLERVEGVIQKVFLRVAAELVEMYGTGFTDHTGGNYTLDRCKEIASGTIALHALKWFKFEGIQSVAEKGLSDALEELSLHEKPKSWPGQDVLRKPKKKLYGKPPEPTPKRIAWFKAKCVALFWQLQMEASIRRTPAVKNQPKEKDFEELFQFSPDSEAILKALEEPLPAESQPLKDGKWVYFGKSERALIVAFADTIRQRAGEGKISLKKDVSANEIAKALASHLGVDWPARAYRARYQNGVKGDGPAYDYQEFKLHFLEKL